MKKPRSRKLFLNKIISETVKLYNYSAAIVARLSFWYSYPRAVSMIEALRRPPRDVVIRVNMLRSNPRYVFDELKQAGLNPSQSKYFREVITIPLEGPFELDPNIDKKIIVKIQAAEEIMTGAPRLYDPGVIEIGDGIKPGDKVAIVTKYGDYVAEAISKVASGEKPIGLVAEIEKSLYYKPNLRALRVFIRGFAYEADLASTQALHMWNPERNSKILLISPRLPDLIWTIAYTRGRAEYTVVSKTENEEEKLRRGLISMKMDDIAESIEWIAGEIRKIRVQENTFDYIYIHPWSTKTGIRPRLTAFLKERDFIRCHKDAWFLLNKFSHGLTENGKLLYLTESLDPVEGEYIVERSIRRLGLTPVKVPIKFGSRGIQDFEGADAALRVYPDIHDDIGLFAIVMTKKG